MNVPWSEEAKQKDEEQARVDKVAREQRAIDRDPWRSREQKNEDMRKAWNREFGGDQ